MQRFIEKILSFFALFGVEYAVLRYVFHVGHLSAALAYIDAGISLSLVRIAKKLGAL